MKYIVFLLTLLFCQISYADKLFDGRASWYGPGFHGKRTANGETFNQNDLTAAHKTLPFGTVLCVTNKSTGTTVRVRVNDRGPYINGRHLDLSKGAADKLGFISRGTCQVTYKVCN